jgi:hypothetical protein
MSSCMYLSDAPEISTACSFQVKYCCVKQIKSATVLLYVFWSLPAELPVYFSFTKSVPAVLKYLVLCSYCRLPHLVKPGTALCVA